MRIALPGAALVAAFILLWQGVEPVPTWFYVVAWYPTLWLLDAIAVRMGARSLFANRTRIASVFGWSVVIWLIFEAFNFRVQNWYYVYLPRFFPERWAGITLSFATVVPAVVLAERVLAGLGVGSAWSGPPRTHGLRHVDHFVWIGLALLGLVVWLPGWFYPLLWGAWILVADPVVYRRQPGLSLIADVERGHWGRIGRLMAGGLVIGALWEGYNHWARGKWIYTVPLLEDLKWFEMPPLGFVGFPFFALEAWSMYHLLVVLGVAAPLTAGDQHAAAAPHPPARPRRALVPAAAAAAALFSLGTLAAMERFTISSTVPVLGVEPQSLGGVRSVWELAQRDPATLAAGSGVAPDSAEALVEFARLATLRGIGTGHAFALARVNVRSVCALAARDPGGLWGHLHAINPVLSRRPTEPEVRVWVRAARRACPA